MRWDDLNMGDKSRMIKLAVDSGITDLRTIIDVYNSYATGGDMDESKGQQLVDRINSTSNANFVQRLKDSNRKSIPFRNTGSVATHRLGYAEDENGAIVYPEVQEINGELVDLGRAPHTKWAALDSAIEHGDTLRMTTPEAEWYTQNYKKYYPGFNQYDNGGYIPSDDIKKYIKGTEAFRRNWYKDANGVETVGYGFTGKKVKELYPNGMTRQQADKYFEDLVGRFATRMAQLTPNIDKLSQDQKDALFSYFYNIGEGNYSTESPKMQKALQDEDWDAVRLNIDAGYNDSKNPGLRKRRDYERALFERGTHYPLQPVPPAQNIEVYYNPEVTRRTTAVPYAGVQEETVNPFMFAPKQFEPGGYLWDPANGVEQDNNVYYDPSLTEPAVVTDKLPAKFHGSQEAARRYAEGYKWGQKNVAEKRDKIAPYLAAGMAGTMVAPVLLDAGAIALANPYVRTALDVAGNIDGVRNLLSNNGIQKTVRLVKEGNTWGAVKSGVGDTLDAMGAADLARFPLRLMSKANRTLHAFDAIPPIGYTDHANRARTWIKNVLTDKTVNIDNPGWYDNAFRDRAASYIPHVKGLEALNSAGKLAGEARFDAWRLYNNLPQKYNTYIPNVDGTYRYNLKKVQKYSPKMTPDTFTTMNYRHSGNTSDLFTSAGGNLEYDNLYNFGLDPTNPNRSYELREIIDRWDLHPLADLDQRQLSGMINSLWQQPVQKIREAYTFNHRNNPIIRGVDNALNKLRYKDIDFTKWKWFDKLYDKATALEVGQITGGKPFLMRTEIPHTVDLTNDKTLWGFVGDNVPASVVDYRNGMPLQNIVKKHSLPKTDMAHIQDLEFYNDLLEY